MVLLPPYLHRGPVLGVHHLRAKLPERQAVKLQPKTVRRSPTQTTLEATGPKIRENLSKLGVRLKAGVKESEQKSGFGVRTSLEVSISGK